jgi:hypothetical protein
MLNTHYYHDENTVFHDYMQNNTHISPEYLPALYFTEKIYISTS